MIMKKFLIVLTLCLLLAIMPTSAMMVNGSNPYYQPDLSRVVAYIPGNGSVGSTDITDLMGHTVTSSKTGYVTINQANGTFKYSNPMKFNGTTGSRLWIDNPNINLSNNYPIQMFAWVNQTSSEGAIFTSHNRSARGDGEFVFSRYKISNYDSSDKYTLGSMWSASVWHFVFFERISATRLNCYVDGVYVKGLDIGATDKLGSIVRNISIGAEGASFDNPLTGYVDDWVIYNGTLIRNTSIPDREFIKILNGEPIAYFSGPTLAGSPIGAAQIGETVFFNDTGYNADSWDWSFGDETGNVTTQNATHIYGSPGTYTVTLIASNAYGSDIATMTVKAGYFNRTALLYLPMNESSTFEDKSAYGWPVINNGATLASSPGDFNGSGYFNGSVDLWMPPASNNLYTNNFSISFFVNSSQTNNGGYYIATLPADGNRNINGMWYLGIVNSGKIWFEYRDGSPSATGMHEFYSTSTFVDGKRHFIRIVRKGAVFTCYIDGIVNNSMTTSTTDRLGGVLNTTIGYDGDEPRYLTGYLDDMLILVGDGYNVTEVPATSYMTNAVTSYTGPPVTSFTASNTSGLQPVIVHFTDTSAPAATGWGWNATCLENSTTIQFSTEQNPTHTFDAGHWLITLLASNAYGQDFSNQVTWVNVSAEVTPLAMFSASKNYVIFPGYVTFTDLSSNTPTVWEWSFGDGTYSTDRNSTHQFLKRGRWTVLLNASNAAGYSYNTTSIIVAGG